MTDREKTRICHIVNIITGKSDGVYGHLKMLFKYTDSTRFEHYLVFQGNKIIEEEVKKLGVKVTSLPSLNHKFPLKAFYEFARIIRKEKFEIIHVHMIKPYIISGILNIFFRKIMIFNYHGLFINNKYYNYFGKMILRTCHLIISSFNVISVVVAPSKKSKEILLDETKLFRRIETFYNGYDPSSSNSPDKNIIDYLLNLKKNGIIIGIVARMEIQKRIDLALKIAKEVIKKERNIHFIFMGDGPLENEMKLLATFLEIDSNISILGYVQNAKNYIKYFDLVMLTSDWEGLPLTLWESMAAGIPVVSTDVGGIKEILAVENCGIIFPKGNIENGVESIMVLINDDIKRLQMGANGIRAVKEKYNTANFSDYFNNLYLSLIK